MKTRTKILSIVLALMLAGVMSACGDKEGDVSETGSTETTASDVQGDTGVEATVSATESSEPEIEDSSENELLNFVGTYVCDGYSMDIQAIGKKGGYVMVNLDNGDGSQTHWEMNGEFDAPSMTLSYNDCVRIDSTMDGEGNGTDNKAYENGMGKIIFAGDETLTWHDNQDNVADGLTFTFDIPIER